MSVLQTVDACYHPIGIAYEPVTRRVWVACYGIGAGLRRSMRRHALWMAGLAVVVAAAGSRWPGSRPIGTATVCQLAASTAACPPADRRPGPPPAWARARRATILVDSVLLGGVPALGLRGWRTASLGRPAIMLPAAEQQIRAGGRWRRWRSSASATTRSGSGTAQLPTWAAAFDRQARALVEALRARGAPDRVGDTARCRARRDPLRGLWQFDAYAWYFPYVNERLRRLDRARDDLVLAEWDRVSKRTGVTYDAIHVNPRGASLMARTIHAAIDGAADDQRPPRTRPAAATARS